MKAEGLPRSFRIRRASELRALMTQGKRHRTDHLDLFIRPSPVGHSRLAVIVPRYAQTAVQRNRLRRQLRELGRRAVLPALPAPTDLAVRARPAAYGAGVRTLRNEIVRFLCASWAEHSSC